MLLKTSLAPGVQGQLGTHCAKASKTKPQRLLSWSLSELCLGILLMWPFSQDTASLQVQRGSEAPLLFALQASPRRDGTTPEGISEVFCWGAVPSPHTALYRENRSRARACSHPGIASFYPLFSSPLCRLVEVWHGSENCDLFNHSTDSWALLFCTDQGGCCWRALPCTSVSLHFSSPNAIYNIYINIYILTYIYTYFELNKVIKMMKIKHKRKIMEKATPVDVHQPSMLSATFFSCFLFFHWLSLKES